MARDYAKKFYVGSPRKKPSSSKWFIAALSVVLLVMCLGVAVKLKSKMALPSEGSQHFAMFAHFKSIFIRHPQALVGSQAKKPLEAAEPEVKFSFYNELPNMRVEVPKNPAVISSTISSLPNTNTKAQVASSEPPGYFLQFGVFNDASSASQLRLSLLLAGIESEVEKVEGTGEKSYRVWQGSYATLAEAKSYQQKWHNKGVESIIKKDS